MIRARSVKGKGILCTVAVNKKLTLRFRFTIVQA